MIERLLLDLLLTPLAWFRRTLELKPGAYALFMLPQAQPLLEVLGRIRARSVFLRARRDCPAYARFLEAERYAPRRPWDLRDVPVTTKENYVKRYSIEERCYGGALSGRGEVIDESSGSSGIPNNWIRNRHERHDVTRVLQLSYGLIYDDPKRILLNCFALGPWATGMHVSMSLADVGTLKSIGPDAAKLENTLKLFGPGYRYIVFGYPPFVKSFVDATSLDLKRYHLDLVVGGEGITEALRAYLLRHFKSVVSSYGASDLEINIGVETEWTIALRARCALQPELSRALFGRDTPPMVFQYNALDYLIERLENGELAFTICRGRGAAPKLRYNLHDVGGVHSFQYMARELGARGVDAGALAARYSHFPVLHVYGRADLTVAFFGAKVYPADVESVVLGHADLATNVHSFQFESYEDERVDRRLAIHLELAPGRSAADVPLDPSALAAEFYRGLARSNQDFREVTRMFGPGAIEVHLHPHATGRFEGADVRLKRQYVRPSPS
jgi:phenylacetate-CoA ligase